jgi:hypothetical protein
MLGEGLLRGGVGNGNRCRQRTVRRDIERRSIRHHAGSAPQGKLALLSKVAVDLERRKSPWIWRCVSYTRLKKMLVIAVVLLEMMRAQKQPFCPSYFAVPGH